MYSVCAELFDRVLLLDSFAIELPAPEVVLGVAAPELRVPAQPASRVALAHLGQRRCELSVEQHERQQLPARTAPSAQRASHHREVDAPHAAEASVALFEGRLGQPSDLPALFWSDERVGDRPVGSQSASDPIGPG